MNIQIGDPAYRTNNDILINYINNANVEQAYAMLKDGEIKLEVPNKLGMTPLHVL
jgi:hypothetical protein